MRDYVAYVIAGTVAILAIITQWLLEHYMSKAPKRLWAGLVIMLAVLGVLIPYKIKLDSASSTATIPDDIKQKCSVLIDESEVWTMRGNLIEGLCIKKGSKVYDINGNLIRE